MKRILTLFLAASSFILHPSSFAAEPLRVFIRSGPKSHGPGAHDHPSFLRDWVPLLNERGANASGGDAFPTGEQLDKTDVLIIHRDGGGDFKPEERALLDTYTKRGGGIVVIHAGSVANSEEGTDYYKNLIGGSWRKGVTKWLEGPMNLYFTDRENLITKDCSNFEMDDEIYYDMDLDPGARVLAAAYTPKPRDTGGKGNKEAQARAAAAVKKGGVNVYDIQPQVWTYEPASPRKGDSPGASPTYRAFVCIPGHYHKNFSHPVMRALILRGIAWTGKRANVDELCKPAELGDNLRYVEGGPTRPEKAAEKLEVHPEFNISLVASEPLVNKVMNIDWDEKGRLWVCETPEYPNGRRVQNTDPWKDAGSLYPGKYDREPQDRISWLEDTNGDGVMDKKHVFADELELVTSFCFYKNGVIACAAPDIWYLEDTTGKGVCDKRTKLYTGLGIGDTHAVMNNLRWGLDGWIYATHGYSAGDVTPLGMEARSEETQRRRDTEEESDSSSPRLRASVLNPVHIGSGVVRFKPDGTAIEQYSSRGGNTWGLCMTWDGQCFWTQPTSGTVFFHTVLPESVLAKGKIPGTTSWKGMITGQKTYPLMKWEEQAYVQIDQVGNYTAAAGCAVYEGGAWPEKWNYSYFTGEPTINIVSQYFVKRDGVSFSVEKEKGREETEFIRSRDMWFRPIETRIGPDGALYIVDFYNQAVIHNDTRGPLHGPANAAVRPDRDHYFSRVWKVQHKEARKLEVPALDKKDPKELVNVIAKAPNAHVKMNAWRLLLENRDLEAAKDFAIKNAPAARGGLLTSAAYQARMNADVMEKLLALDVASEAGAKGAAAIVERQLIPGMMNPKRTLLEIYMLGFGASDGKIRKVILESFAKEGDSWKRSALIAAASAHPALFLEDCLQADNPGVLEALAEQLAPLALKRGNEPGTVKLLTACASAPSGADGLKKIILEGIARNSQVALAMDPSVAEALKKLLANPATAGAALPLVAKWDTKGVLAAEMKARIASLTAKLADKSAAVPDRIVAVRALLGASTPDAREKVAATLVGAETPEPLQREIISALGDSGNASDLVPVMGKLKPSLQSACFDQILKRTEATQALLAALNQGKLNSSSLSPSDVARLRTHPNKQIAGMANRMLDKLISPVTKEKNAIIAKLTPEVEKPGNAANGKALFTGLCAVCHKLGDIGRDVAPPLAGMGAHGPAELLVHVIDPNREVDPTFWQWNITRRNGDMVIGVITQENPSSLTLKNQTGDLEIGKGDIRLRENTHRSLMPEGFEALGPDALRDILAFICGSETRFRIVNLAGAYTGDTRRGLFADEKHTGDSVFFSRFGNITAEGVPYFIQDPGRSQTGANVIVLKGGGGKNAAQSFPQRVEIAMNTAAKRLHFLSGIAGWGYPATKDDRPAMKVTITHADGRSEVTELKNGDAFADYNKVIDVPGSKLVEGAVSRGQLRRITLPVKNPSPITKLTLESYDNRVTPVVCAITADLAGAGPEPRKDGTPAVPRDDKSAAAPGIGPKEGGKGDGPLAPATPVSWEPGKTKVLLIGGGSSHDFARFFGESDSATLKAAGFSVHYTEDRDQAAAELKNADVAVISVNRKFFDTAEYRQALLSFADAGKGIIMLHPGTWYGFPQWPELNAKIIGGGARGHDAIDKFTVSVLKKNHPVMKGVPASFTAEDELYYVNPEPDKIPTGTAPIDVLARTSPSKKYNKSHPSVWITEHEKAKIVGIALGHDQRVHDLDPYKTILINAVRWTSGK